MAGSKLGYVYLLEGNGDWAGWYRIGRTTNVAQRFSYWRWVSRNGRYGLKPIFLVRVSNQVSTEKAFHNLFDHRRGDFRRRGMGQRREWFKLTQSDVDDFKDWAGIIGTDLIELNGKWPR